MTTATGATIDDLAAERRFFAEELAAVGNLRPALVEAFATVRREAFLRPGPWTIRGEGDWFSSARQTADADPRRVYHNIAIAIDPARQLYNGQPGTIGLWIDALGLRPGSRVLHIGCGLGYYTAIMAHCTGPDGRVVAVEIDAALAAEARRNLVPLPWVEVRHADGTQPLDDQFDAILVNAGVTHPESTWLDALAPNGRIVLPLTCAMGVETIGKGLVFSIADDGGGSSLAARVLTMVAVYSAVGIRDAAMNPRLGNAIKTGSWGRVQRLRRDVHDEGAGCWLHGAGFCFAFTAASSP